MKRLPGILFAALFAAQVFAGVGYRNEPIVPGGDGKLYSEWPLGNVTPPPAYVALDIDLGSTLSGCGIAAIACGTTGTDFTCPIRSGVTGTNALTALITLTDVSGTGYAAAGFTAPGSGDNLTAECAVPASDASGSFTITASDSNVCTPPNCSTDTTNAKTWAMVGTGGTPPVGNRDLILENDFESGAFTSRSTTTNGVYKDAARVQMLTPRATFTINAVTKANPALITWAGADPTLTNPSLSGANSTTGNAGFTIGSVTGMTQLADRLVRCLPGSINTGANTCTLRKDGNDDQSSDGNQDLGDSNVNSSGYGVFSGTATATLWQQEAFDAPGSLGPSSTNDVHVVTAATAASNLNGAASAFGPRSGNYFLSTVINKTHDYSAIGGQGGKNKPRWNLFYVNEGGAPDGIDVANGEEHFLAFSIGLPSNYDSNDAGGVANTEDHMVRMAEYDAQDEAAYHLSMVGDASGIDHWNLTLDFGTHDNTGTGRHDIDLGAVTASIGKWTDWLFDAKIQNSSAGFLKLYKRICNSNGSGCGSWSTVYSRTGAAVGHTYAGGFRLGVRAYKYGWNHKADTTPSLAITYYYDEIRFGRSVQDVSTCADVTVDGSNPC